MSKYEGIKLEAVAQPIKTVSVIVKPHSTILRTVITKLVIFSCLVGVMIAGKLNDVDILVQANTFIKQAICYDISGKSVEEMKFADVFYELKEWLDGKQK